MVARHSAGTDPEQFALSPDGAYLYRLLDHDMKAVPVRADGITLSQNIANKLDVDVGDRITMQATDGHQATAELTVVAVVAIKQLYVRDTLHEATSIPGESER